jgi:erythromycin esterase-like protein
MLKANDPNLASATTGYAMWRETTVLPLSGWTRRS